VTEISPLCRRMTEDMIVRNLSPATQRFFIGAIFKLSLFWPVAGSAHFGGCSDVSGAHGCQGDPVPGLNQVVCALQFFCGVTLRRDEIPERIAYARQPRKLPEVLNADEVVRFLEAVPSLRTHVALPALPG
jgi:integrase/recombinase XerD